jgi:hypothetical protein
MAPSRQGSQISCAYDTRRRKRPRHVSSIIERLARAGEQAGFSVEQLIEILNAGVSIGALLDMISYSLSHKALESYTGAAEVPTSASAPCVAKSAKVIPMDCLECKNLKEAFESRLSKYIEACSDAYYRVSTELAAKRNVDMERAKSNFEEHQLVCVSAAEARQYGRDSTLGWHGDIQLSNLCLRADQALRS